MNRSPLKTFEQPFLIMSLSNPLTLGKKKDYLKVRRSIGATTEDIGSTVTIRQSTSTTVNPPLLQKKNLPKRNHLLVAQKKKNLVTTILPRLKSCLKSPKPLLLPLSNHFHRLKNLPQQPHKQVQFLEVPNPQRNNLVTFLLHLCPKGKYQPFHKPGHQLQVL
jgi:hypothetical protein